jgi:hypothetical protein
MTLTLNNLLEKYFSIGSEEEAVEYFKKHLSDTIKEKFN